MRGHKLFFGFKKKKKFVKIPKLLTRFYLGEKKWLEAYE